VKNRKKDIKRCTLELKKETIVQLGDGRLQQVVGGAVAGTTNSACCNTTWK
jgi:hypothetical protein